MVAKISKFSKQKRQVFEGVLAAAVFVIVFGGIVGFFVFQNVNTYQRRAGLENRLQELQAQASDLVRQKEILEAAVADTQTEEYQERVLREQGLYKKEGEEVVTVLPPEDESEVVPRKENTKERVWWQPWTWFGGE